MQRGAPRWNYTVLYKYIRHGHICVITHNFGEVIHGILSLMGTVYIRVKLYYKV